MIVASANSTLEILGCIFTNIAFQETVFDIGYSQKITLKNISFINNTIMLNGITIHDGWSSIISMKSIKFVDNIVQLQLFQFFQLFSLNQTKTNVLMMEDCLFARNQANDSLINIIQQNLINIKIIRSNFTKNYNFSFGAVIVINTVANSGNLFAQASIEDCLFDENNAKSSGSLGVIYLGNFGGNITIIRSNFSKNNLSRGAVIYLLSSLQNSALLIQDCLFVENNASDVGGAIGFDSVGGNITIMRSNFSKNFDLSSGAAICVLSSPQNSALLIQDCSFVENNASEYGGSIYLESIGGIICVLISLQNSVLSIQDCSFVENNARDIGGAIYLQSVGNITMMRSNFSKNFDLTSGSAIYLLSSLQNSAFFIEDCIFFGNQANISGGAIYLEDLNGNIKLLRNNFTLNYALSFGAAIYFNQYCKLFFCEKN